jgi:hypothetical protein
MVNPRFQARQDELWAAIAWTIDRARNLVAERAPERFRSGPRACVATRSSSAPDAPKKLSTKKIVPAPVRRQRRPPRPILSELGRQARRAVYGARPQRGPQLPIAARHGQVRGVAI